MKLVITPIIMIGFELFFKTNVDLENLKNTDQHLNLFHFWQLLHCLISRFTLKSEC